MRYWEIHGIAIPADNEETTFIEELGEETTLGSLKERDEVLAYRLISRGILTHDPSTDIISVIQNQEVDRW